MKIMKKLTISGVDVNPTFEDVYKPRFNIYGLKVTVKYLTDGIYDILPIKTETFNNVSEFHNKNGTIHLISKTHKNDINLFSIGIEEIIVVQADRFEMTF